MIRQGDVLVEPVEVIPANVKSVPRDKGRVVLAYGEVTGHAHTIAEPGCEMYEAADGNYYIRCASPATIVHQEHGTLPLAPGTYRVWHQREWSDSNEAFRVKD